MDALKNAAVVNERSVAREDGMTLIEIMIVIAILGMMAGIAGVALIKNLQEARNQTALTQIRNLESALKLYNRDCGKYPGTAGGLNDLIVKPAACPRWKGYLDDNVSSIPLDPWGEPYEYFHPGTHGHEVEIISKGKDGDLNTADDIVSWDQSGGGAGAEGAAGGKG